MQLVKNGSNRLCLLAFIKKQVLLVIYYLKNFGFLDKMIYKHEVFYFISNQSQKILKFR